MKKILLGIVVLLLMVSVGYCREQALQLTIKPDKELYEVGEEIKLSMIFRNISNKEISFCKFLLKYRLMSNGIELKRHDGIVYRMTSRIQLEMPVITEEDFVPLLPNREYALELQIPTVSISDSEWILFGEKGETQEIPSGIYQVKSTYDNNYDFIETEEGMPKKITVKNVWTGTLTSNTITIEVTGEKSISKEEAIKLVQNYIRKQNINVKDINTPSKIREYEDFWSITYAIEQEPVVFPPFRSFNVHKDTGRTYEVPRE